jgi:hypothetical protein
MRICFAFPLAAVIAVVGLGSVGCSSSHGTQAGTVDPNDGGGGGPGGNPEGGGFGNGSDAGPTTGGDCNADTKTIYVVSEENTLYSFTPETLSFKPIGVLNCLGTGGANPTSMAVDRTGTAWVLLSDGSINKVSVKDATCTPTSYVPGQAGFMKFGMGFATDGTSGAAETLYLSDHDGKGLAKLDTTSMKVTAVGAYTGQLAGISSELTGTGDGKLFGFFTTLPNATVAQIDKNAGALSGMSSLMDTPPRTAWAFSFYAGVFYVYTAGDPASSLPKDGVGSDVTLYDPVANTTKIVKSKVGFRIVGAGVSTCVPTTAVK